MPYVYNYLEGELLCVTDCNGAGEVDFAPNPGSGELNVQVNVCCTDACRYAVDQNTGLLFPVLCDT